MKIAGGHIYNSRGNAQPPALNDSPAVDFNNYSYMEQIITTSSGTISWLQAAHLGEYFLENTTNL